MDKATAEEKRPDGVGVRAWLRPMSVVTVLGIAGGAYVALGCSPWGTGLAALAVLLAYPVSNMMMATGQLDDGKAEQELAEERSRVLAMVETGKITGEDGAELIGALGQSHSVQGTG